MRIRSLQRLTPGQWLNDELINEFVARFVQYGVRDTLFLGTDFPEQHFHDGVLVNGETLRHKTVLVSSSKSF